MKTIRRHRISATRRRTQIGLPPGSLVYTGEATTEAVRVTRFWFHATEFKEETIEDVSTIRRPTRGDGVTWINFDGVHDTKLLEKIGEEFAIDSLVMEDIVNLEQRPKMETHGEYLFVTLKMLGIVPGEQFDVASEQISFIIGRHFVLSFQERTGDTFDPVRDRIRGAVGRVRKMGADYLAYALIDSIVDSYFVLVEALGLRIEELDGVVIESQDIDTMREIHAVKREIIDIRRVAWPMREVINQLERDESKIITNTTRAFLRDVYDHAIQVIDMVESYRDMASGLADLYMSAAGNRMNEVMKVLTIIATIFIPLTFIAGVYGMNFDPNAGPLSMPELKQPLGYVVTLGVMALIAFGMFIYFKRKKWL